MKRLALTGLVKIELPDDTIRLCDGGFFVWGAETYRSLDATFGTISSIDALTEGVGDEVPALDLLFLPPSTAAVADLSQPGYQKSRARFWLAEYDVETGLIDGDPDLLFDGQIDQTTLTVGRDTRELAMSIVSNAERLFERNIGNSLNAAFQKAVWPGDTGHDNATGLGRQVAWGVESPAGVGVYVSGGSGGATWGGRQYVNVV